jgi:hypothetical protein
LKEAFGALVESLKDLQTASPPRSMVKRPDKEDTLIPVGEQTKFRSGVGMLLDLVKHSRFDIANSGRELSKSTEAEYVALPEITKEVIFVKQMLETMGIGVKLPIIVNVDNAEAIYSSKNNSL